MEKTKTPKSQIDWQKKYDSEKMATIGIKVPTKEKELLSETAKKHNMKLATFMRKCAKYCIDNDIDLSEKE